MLRTAGPPRIPSHRSDHSIVPPPQRQSQSQHTNPNTQTACRTGLGCPILFLLEKGGGRRRSVRCREWVGDVVAWMRVRKGVKSEKVSGRVS